MSVVKAQKEVKLGTAKRIQGILTGVIDEEPLQGIPLNYDLNFICSSLKHHNPSKKEFVRALDQYGYQAVQTYYNAKLWKTNAPPDVLYDLFKAHKWWSHNQDEAKVFTNLKEGTPGDRILKKPLIRADIEFNAPKEKEGNDQEPKKLLGSKTKQKKYFDNPEPNWGPKARATSGKDLK